MEHFTYGLTTPIAAYVMACIGSALGLRCTARALSSSGGTKRAWLTMASIAIGSGIWTMHFIAMLGFSVTGSPIRYDVPLTLASLVVAIVVVSAGIFTVGYGTKVVRALVLGGIGTGLGVATMHYTGMAAVHVYGSLTYHIDLVALSVAIAVAAATAALVIMLWVRSLLGALGAALVMGVAVAMMHYTAMAAVQFELTANPAPLTGAEGMDFLFPMAMAMTIFLVVATIFVGLFPADEDNHDDATHKPPVEPNQHTTTNIWGQPAQTTPYGPGTTPITRHRTHNTPTT